ncbi:TIGR03862 family flavoprotein [Halobacteriovorax sp.]|uniref:TIGR03862 family flavoprotein n=1 Tax=Halobacteriovorax sp. TaxID=2020862 RepID=UPI00356B20DE
MSKAVNIVGAGPSGLFCSYLLIKAGMKVNLFDQTGGVGKKFLVAGNGGLNLTHSEDLEKFVTRYGENSELFASLIGEFTPTDMREWCDSLGVETFIGSSGRVFPKKLKAADLLNRWLTFLKESSNFTLNLKHRLTNATISGELTFDTPDGELVIQEEYTIMCLGGGSWKKTGSDGRWIEYLRGLNLNIKPFQSMNCGFSISWSDRFLEDFDDDYLKNIKVSYDDRIVSGEVMITKYGIEGGAIYAHSAEIQRDLLKNISSKIHIDLKPLLSEEIILEKLSRPRKKNSMSNHLRKALNLSKLSLRLLREVLPKETFEDVALLAKSIKSLPLELITSRPLDEAISTSGGVSFESVDNSLMIRGSNSIFLAGEMLDWEAPTGGYLLQGCFSMSHHVVKSILAKNS